MKLAGTVTGGMSGRAAEALGIGRDGAGVVPPRRQQVLEIQHAGGFAVRQQQLALGGAVGGVEQVGHDREQAADALGRQLQEPAVLEAGDQLAIDDLRRVDAAALEQAGEDGHQGDAGAIDLDAEVQRERARFRHR